MAKLEKLVEQVQTHLDEGEKVLVAVRGSYEIERMGQDSTRKGIFAATDHRLVLYAKKMTGYDFEVFPYENISSIEMGKSMMGHHVKFFASGNEAKMKWIDKHDDVGELVKTVRSRMRGGSPSATPAAAEAPKDLAAEIRKLRAARRGPSHA